MLYCTVCLSELTLNKSYQILLQSFFVSILEKLRWQTIQVWKTSLFSLQKNLRPSIYIYAILIFCKLEHYRNCNNGTCKLKLQKVKNADYIICVIPSTFVQLSFSRLSYKYILPCKNQVQNRVYRYVSIPIQHATFLIHNIFFSKCTHWCDRKIHTDMEQLALDIFIFEYRDKIFCTSCKFFIRNRSMYKYLQFLYY